MTDRDRLIELLNKAEDICENTLDCDSCKYLLSGSCKTVLIADYLLANGVSVLPVPLGTTVFEIRARGKRTIMWSSRKCDYGIINDCYIENAKAHDLEFYIKEKSFVKADCARWNKTIFLTKEEAEERLKKINEMSHI